jgi:hypothetical protein
MKVHSSLYLRIPPWAIETMADAMALALDYYMLTLAFGFTVRHFNAFYLTLETIFKSSAFFLVDACANHDDKRTSIFSHDCICSLSIALKHAQ